MTKPKLKADDPEQAKRFAAAVRELEAKGDIDPATADAEFDRAFGKIVPAKQVASKRAG